MQRFNYQYDEAGRITGIDLDGQSHRYRYDAVGRLTNALTPSGEFDYAYDPNGNRLSESTQTKAAQKMSTTSTVHGRITATPRTATAR